MATGWLALTDVFDRSERVAAILHDPALSDDVAFNATAASYVLTALDQRRLGRGDRAARARGPRGARPGSSPRPRRSDGGSSTICTTARSSASSRSGIRLGLAAERAAELGPGLRRAPARARQRGRPGARGGQLRWPATAARRC